MAVPKVFGKKKPGFLPRAPPARISLVAVVRLVRGANSSQVGSSFVRVLPNRRSPSPHLPD